MYNNVFFMGGIHGVGKSTICERLCNIYNMQYLSASDVLKWKTINSEQDNKKIKNVIENQDRLIIGLKSVVKEDNLYFLDGHYCLLNKEEAIVQVPMETFRQINPLLLCLIVGDIGDIKQRLQERDKQSYSASLLARMQAAEIDYAKEVSKVLDVPLTIGDADNFGQIISSINAYYQKGNN